MVAESLVALSNEKEHARTMTRSVAEVTAAKDAHLGLARGAATRRDALHEAAPSADDAKT